jgi:hypothetical protein
MATTGRGEEEEREEREEADFIAANWSGIAV